MKDLLKRFTSRKFLLAVASFLTLIANKDFAAGGAVAAVYAIAQAYVDANQG